MTPSELELAARQRYNAVGETFWSQAELLTLEYLACLEIARETKCIERTYSTTTVASTQEYSYPTNVISIKRVTYNNIRLEPIDMRRMDNLTLNSDPTTITGSSFCYSEWNGAVVLFPTPDSAVTLKIYSFNEPQVLTASSTLEVPSVFHSGIINYMLSEMYAKDKDFDSAKYYKDLWIKDIQYAKKWISKRRRGDSFASVVDETSISNILLGFR